MGESGGTLRLVVLLLLSLTALVPVSSDSQKDYAEQLYKLADGKCPDIRDTLDEKAFLKMESCGSQKLDMERLERNFKRAGDKKVGLNAGFSYICEKWSTIQVCLKPLFDNLKKCIPIGDKFVKAVDSLVRGICKSPARIIDLVADDGFQCYSSGMREFQICGANALPTRAKTTKETCKFLADVEDCAQAEFSECKDPTLIQSLVGDVAKSLKCTGVSGLTYSNGAADHLFSHGSYILPISIIIFAKNYFD